MNIGILGCGHIAHTLAKTIKKMEKEDIHLVACGSRTLDKAQEFAKKFHIPAYYGTYEELVNDNNVDLVYVATPHSKHYEDVMLALDHNKNVLCEKAFTTSSKLAEEMIALAKEKNLLLAEAIWTRYMPYRKMVQELLDSGTIGQPKLVTANLCYLINYKSRLIKPELGGGTLLDLGIYPLNFACMFFPEEITKIEAVCTYTDKHLDETDTFHLTFQNGVNANLYSSMASFSDRKGVIAGDKGYIEVKNINNPERITIYDINHRKLSIKNPPKKISGYEYELRECQEAIQNHQIECPSMPHSEILRMLKIMDTIREQLGIVYPFETQNQ